MELVLCFSLAVTAFVLLIGCLVGLVSAPTPVLLSILVAGIMLTQKSINKFNLPEVKLEERDKNRIESVKIAKNLSNTVVIKANEEEVKTEKSLSAMNYRGSNYRRSLILETNTNNSTKSKANILYRGAKATNS